MIKKTIFVVFIFAITFFIATAVISKFKPAIATPSPVPSVEVAQEKIHPAKEIGEPYTLTIPAIDVDASIEPVGLAPDGRMDVPKQYDEIGWWSLGVKPGQKGSAVLAGHYDTPTGDPGVFYQLKQLQKGDEIKVADTEGLVQSFEVVETKLFSDADFPIDLVFSRQDDTWLNLITCDGVFDSVAQNYLDRYVVFARLID